MVDYFIFIDHKDEIRKLVDITELPSNFDKLIAFTLDPFVYRLEWQCPNVAHVREYWWGTIVGKLVRVMDNSPQFISEIILDMPLDRSSDPLPSGEAASSSPYMRNLLV